MGVLVDSDTQGCRSAPGLKLHLAFRVSVWRSLSHGVWILMLRVSGTGG